MEVANYIYAATLRNEGKSTNDFKATDWEKALHLAAGGSVIEKFGKDKKWVGLMKPLEIQWFIYLVG